MTTSTLTPFRLQAWGPRPSFRDTVRAEWLKLRTVRSSWWTLLVIAVVTIGLGYAVCAAEVARWNHLSLSEKLSFDPTAHSLSGLMLSQLIVGVFGVMVITSEYSTGMIRSTLAAMPRRRQVLSAKALTLVGPVFLVGTLAALVAFLGGQAILADKGIGVSLGAPSEWRAVVGAGAVLTLEALLALGIGVIIRHTAGAIASYVGVVLVAPLILSALPDPWGRDITQYFPFTAGQALMKVHRTHELLPPGTALAVLCAWAVASLGVAAWSITRRDA